MKMDFPSICGFHGEKKQFFKLFKFKKSTFLPTLNLPKKAGVWIPGNMGVARPLAVERKPPGVASPDATFAPTPAPPIPAAGVMRPVPRAELIRFWISAARAARADAASLGALDCIALGCAIKIIENKTGTSNVGAISKAQKAQSFQNMPRTFLWEAQKTVSRRPKLYATLKKEQQLYFSSQGQMVELFSSVRVDWKKSHYYSRVSLHEAPTERFEEGVVYTVSLTVPYEQDATKHWDIFR